MFKKSLFLIVLMILSVSSYAITQNLGSPDSKYQYIHVSTLKYEPYPVQPGRYFDAWIKIENTGQYETDVKFTLTPKYPFSLDESEKAERIIGSLAGKQTALVHYKVRCDVNAIEGSTPLFYEIKTNGRIDSSNVNIWVQTVDANVAINSIKTEDIAQGQASEVAIELENLADSPMTDVSINLGLSNSDVPFVPVNSTTEKKIYSIGPKEKKIINFILMAIPEAKSGVYKIPIEIKFVDGTGKNYTKDSIISLVVGSEPDLMITTAKTDIYSKGQIGTISLKFTNKGLNDLKLVNVQLEESKDYEIISEDKVYLGNIDSDDYETADFRIKINKATNNIAKLNLLLNYLDSSNKKYSQRITYEYKIVDAKKSGANGSSDGIGKIIFVALVLVIGFFVYKKWEKKKLHHKK